MSYDRYEQRPGRRGPRARFEQDRYGEDRYRRDGERDERGFLDRAGDEIASWFGDEQADHRRELDAHDHRGPPQSERGLRTSEGGGEARRRAEFGRHETERDGERSASQAGYSVAAAPRFDPHYDEWRRHQIDALDRDYDEYRRENQARFDSEFSNWRSQRQTKRQLLADVREHMEVVGSDNEHVGKVDRVAGDRIILAKNDPDAGGTHHSLSCPAIDRVEGDKVILDTTADLARKRWRDDNRERALFEPEDQGSAGPEILNRSFSGTYR